MVWCGQLGQALISDKYWKHTGLTNKYKIVLKKIIQRSKFIDIFQTPNITNFLNNALMYATTNNFI